MSFRENDMKGTDQEDRRAFLGRAGKAAVGVPATAFLLSVTNKRAKATYDPYYEPKEPYKPI